MTISVVQTSSVANFPNGGAGNTATITFTGVTAGNTIIVLPFCIGAAAGTPTCSVNDGSAYSVAIRSDNYDASVTNCLQAEIHYLQSVSGGTHSIVVTNAAGSTKCFGQVIAIEVAGLATQAPSSTNANHNTGSTNPTSGSVTPATLNSIMIAVATLNDISSTTAFGDPPSGFTTIVKVINGSVSASPGACDYLIQAATNTAHNPSWATFTDSNAWSAAIAVFEGAAAALPVGSIYT